MRLGVDCAKLVKGTSKSIGIYNVASAIVQGLAGRLKDDTLVVIGNDSNKEDFDIDGVEFHPVNLDINSNKELLKWELFKVNSVIKQLELDSILFPRGFNSIMCPVRNAVIIHDMIPFYYHENFPKVFNPIKNGYVMWRLKASAKSADVVITDSEYSKKEITRFVPSAKNKTKVITIGYDDISQYSGGTSGYGDYFFGITSRLPHKNAGGLVKAYVRYCEIAKNPYKLVLAGVPSEDALGFEIPGHLKDKIVFNKFLDDKDFYGLMLGAKGMVFVPFIEGFGIPPLEAMSCGIPVVCSGVTSLPEVAGNAAALVKPDDVEDIALAMKKVSEDEEYRKLLVSRGYENVKRFAWEDRLDKYLAVMKGEK